MGPPEGRRQRGVYRGSRTASISPNRDTPTEVDLKSDDRASLLILGPERACSEVERSAVLDDLERAEDSELHAPCCESSKEVATVRDGRACTTLESVSTSF